MKSILSIEKFLMDVEKETHSFSSQDFRKITQVMYQTTICENFHGLYIIMPKVLLLAHNSSGFQKKILDLIIGYYKSIPKYKEWKILRPKKEYWDDSTYYLKPPIFYQGNIEDFVANENEISYAKQLAQNFVSQLKKEIKKDINTIFKGSLFNTNKNFVIRKYENGDVNYLSDVDIQLLSDIEPSVMDQIIRLALEFYKKYGIIINVVSYRPLNQIKKKVKA